MKTINFHINQLKQLALAKSKSHKGQNGRVLVIGGSTLFHSASLWAAELLAHFVDLVFYYSPTLINRKIYLGIKTQFRNGIVVSKADLFNYVKEADVVLIGPGMLREGSEGRLTRKLTNQLLKQFTQQKFVIDAGALQELEPENIRPQHILTPHWLEFTHLFPSYQHDFQGLVKRHPATYLLKKTGTDYVFSWSKPQKITQIAAGNEGLTKGGTGDLLAALVAAFYVKNSAVLSAAAASYVLNKTAEALYQQTGPYYSTTELLAQIPTKFWQMLKSLESKR